jgi:hypothetical protein
MGLVLQVMLLTLLVFVCTMIGWLLVQGPRPAKNGDRVASAKQPKKGDRAPAPARTPEEKKTQRRETSEREPREKKNRDREERPKPPEKTAPPAEEPRPRPAPAPEPPPPPPPPAPDRRMLTYEKDILPIMERACLNCHGSRKKRGGLDLRTFAALLKGGDSGAGVKAGKPDDSPLLESVMSNRMPPGKRKLSAEDKKLIRDWIAGGAKSGKGL